jgi:hypothetical protein
MALRWPRDIGGTVTYAVGTGVIVAAIIPIGIYMSATEDRQGLGIVLAVMLGPLVWLLGAPLIGAAILFPLDRLIRHNHVSTSHHDLPMPPDTAWTHFSYRPETSSVMATSGPVEWDGFWVERSIEKAPDPATGQIVDLPCVARIKELHAGDYAQAVLVVPQQARKPDPGLPTSFVIHTTFAPNGAGTRMMRQTSLDRISLGRVLMTWLCDGRTDVVMAECDALAGRPPRALMHLPVDNIWSTLQRFFRWDDGPQP